MDSQRRRGLIENSNGSGTGQWHIIRQDDDGDDDCVKMCTTI